MLGSNHFVFMDPPFFGDANPLTPITSSKCYLTTRYTSSSRPGDQLNGESHVTRLAIALTAGIVASSVGVRPRLIGRGETRASRDGPLRPRSGPTQVSDAELAL